MSASANPGSWVDIKKRHTVHLLLWTLAWLATYALSTFGPLLLWQGNHVLSAFSIAVNFVLGAVVIYANIRLLRSVDEMERKISLEAMSFTLGAGFVVGFSYTLLYRAELIAYQAEPYQLLVLMALVLIASTLIATRRYQ